MRMLAVVLFLALVCQIACACPGGPEGANCRGTSPLMASAQLERDIESGKLSQRTEAALDMLIRVAEGELKKKGAILEGASMRAEWDQDIRYQFRKFVNSKDIGDHAPISLWLSEKYQMLEFILGVEVCKATHLSDMHTLNHAIPIVFRPCTFPMDAVQGQRIDEYRRHFSHGQVYYGLVPVTGYWVVYASVTTASAGTGFIYFSGLIASAAEKLISFVTPGLSDKLYRAACE